MRKLRFSAKFKKDYERVKKRGYNLGLLIEVIDTLCAEQALPEKNRDHALTGKYVSFRECHITPDWLLIYRPEKDTLSLALTRTGTYSDLF